MFSSLHDSIYYLRRARHTRDGVVVRQRPPRSRETDDELPESDHQMVSFQ